MVEIFVGIQEEMYVIVLWRIHVVLLMLEAPMKTWECGGHMMIDHHRFMAQLVSLLMILEASMETWECGDLVMIDHHRFMVQHVFLLMIVIQELSSFLSHFHKIFKM